MRSGVHIRTQTMFGYFVSDYSFTLGISLPSRLVPSAKLMVCVSPRALWLVGDFWYDCIFWDERARELTGQLVDPQVGTAIITTVMSIHRVASGSCSSRCCELRHTHTSADPIRLLCNQLALPLTFSLTSRFAPSARLMFCVSPRGLWHRGVLAHDA